MKKIIISLAFALAGMTSTFAAKAYPEPFTVTQSDGTSLTVTLHGDENFSWSTTSDGVLLVQIGSNYYVAEVEEDGTLKATPQLAHNAELRSETENNLAKSQDRKKFYEATNGQWTALSKSLGTEISTSNNYFPHIGSGENSPRVLVLLVQFPDCKFQSSDPKTAFNYYLNATKGETAPEALTSYYKGANLGSVREYFKDMSNGAFTPIFDIAGVVTVSKSYTYYGEDLTPTIRDYNLKELATEACKLAQSELGVNFSDYDLNNDQAADLVYIIHAGYGQNLGNATNTIWSKTMLGANLELNDNQSVRTCAFNCELNATPAVPNKYITGIGLFSHEFSHCMGMPDLYPSNEKAYLDNQEPEYWDLMDAGEYLRNGYKPAPYSPWEMDVMGWDCDIETLGSTPRQITLPPCHKERKVYKIEAPDGQYLLLQNVQQKGWWAGIYNHGLLIQRIDYSSASVDTRHQMNNNPYNPEITILPADGIVINGYLSGDGEQYQYTRAQYLDSHYGDPFPGSENVTSLTEAKLNRDVTLNNLLYNIQENEDGSISFDYLKDFTTGIDHTAIVNQEHADNRIFSLDGRYLGTDKSQIGKGIYIIGGKKVVVK